MNKKFLVLLIFVVIASISTASAFDLGDLFGNSSDNSTGEKINVSGITFNIPNGFTEVVNQSYENETSDNPYVDFNTTSKAYANASGERFILSVSSSNISANDTFAKDASQGGNKTTINGVDGYTFTGAGWECFTFAKDGKLVIISASNKQLFNETVVA